MEREGLGREREKKKKEREKLREIDSLPVRHSPIYLCHDFPEAAWIMLQNRLNAISATNEKMSLAEKKFGKVLRVKAGKTM